MKEWILSFILLIFGLTSMAMAKAEPMTVFVSILPQQYVVEKIAGETVHVVTMIPPGSEPETYEPKPSQMKELAKAKIYFSIDVPFEKTWLPKIKASNPTLKMFRVDQGIQKIHMANHTHEGDSHVHKHTHKGMKDPHIWLSPVLMKKIAENTYEGLVLVAPQHKEKYLQNKDSLLKEIDKLDATIRSIVKGMPKKSAFMVFHPAWGYYAKEYNLEQIAIEVDGKEPKPAQLKKVLQTAKARHVRVIFVQPQFSQKIARQVAKTIGATIMVADPLALDWANNLLHQTKAFQKAVE